MLSLITAKCAASLMAAAMAMDDGGSMATLLEYKLGTSSSFNPLIPWHFNSSHVLNEQLASGEVIFWLYIPDRVEDCLSE